MSSHIERSLILAIAALFCLSACRNSSVSNADSSSSKTVVQAGTENLPAHSRVRGRTGRVVTAASDLGTSTADQTGIRSGEASPPARRWITTTASIPTTASITGGVIDESGTSVANCLVRAVAVVDKGLTVSRTAVTGAQGDFALRELPAGEVTLLAEAPAHAPGVLLSTAPANNVLIRLATGGAGVTGRVRNAVSGEAVAGASIDLLPRNRYGKARATVTSRSVTSDELGEFTFDHLSSGTYTLQARAPGLRMHKPAEQAGFLVKLKDNETTVVDIPMHAGYSVRGTVLDIVTSTPLPDAVVWIGTGHPNRMLMHTVSDANGKYELRGVFPDDSPNLLCRLEGYRLEKTKTHQRPYLALKFPKEGFVVTQGLRLERAVTISGTVKTVDGKPIANARMMDCEEAWRMKDEAPFSLSDPEGRYKIETRSFQTVTIRAEAVGYAAQESGEVHVKDVGIADVNLVLYPADGEIAGKVIDKSGRAVAAATVKSSRELRIGSGGSSLKFDPVITDEGGEFVLKGLLLGNRGHAGCNFTLYAHKPGMAASKAEQIQLTPETPSKTVILMLQVPHVLAGHVLTADRRPLADAAVQLSSAGEFLKQVTDESGAFRFDDLQPEPVRVYLSHKDYAEKQIEEVPVDNEQAEFIIDQEKVILLGHVVDWKTGRPLSDFEVQPAWSEKVEKTGNPGEFKAVYDEFGIQLTISAPGYARIKTTTLAKPLDGRVLIEKTFPLGPAGKAGGRLVDSAKRPLPDVRIQLDLNANEYNIAKPDALTVSGADGRFELSGVQSGQNLIVFDPQPPLGRVTRKFFAPYGSTVDLGDIVIGELGTITGMVVREPGSVPVPGLRVVVNRPGPDGISRETVSDNEGKFEFFDIPTSKYSVRCDDEAGGYASAQVSVSAGETQSVVLRLGSGIIRGKVMQGGKPASSHAMTITRGPRGAFTEMFYPKIRDGSFEQTNVPPGPWTITISEFSNTIRVRAVEDIELVEGQVFEKTFVLPTCRIVGAVVDSGGQAVSGAVVSVPVQPITTDPAFYPGTHVITAISGHDGLFELSNESLQPGRTTVAASKEGIGSALVRDVDVPLEGDTQPVQLKLRMQGGTLVSLALNMTTGAPLPDAWLRFSGREIPVTGTRGDDGILRVSGIPAGTYTVSVGAVGFSSSDRTVSIKEGEVSSIEDVLYEAGTLRWVFVNSNGHPQKDVVVNLAPEDSVSTEHPREGRTDANGQYLAAGLAPGAYTGTARAPGKQSVSASFNINVHQVSERRDVLVDAVQ